MYSSSFTGIGRYVYELVKRIPELDKNNTYILFLNEPEYSNYTPTAKNIKKVKVNAKHYSLEEQTKFLKILNKEKLDLMHFTHFNRPILYNRPSVVTIHDLTLSFYKGNKKHSFLHKLAYNLVLKTAVKKAKQVITISKNTKKDLKNILKVKEEKIKIIYQAVGNEFKQQINEKNIKDTLKKLKINKKYILYTGVWSPHKNLKKLVQALKILKTKYNYKGLLVITGKKQQPNTEEINKEIKSKKLENDIIKTGMVSEEDLINLYKGAEIYAFPSLYEGFGLPILEAMSAEIPVVASNTSCIPEICGKNGCHLFNPLNEEDIAKKINEVLTNKTLRTNLIKQGKERIKDFSWDKMANQTIEVYKKVLKTK